MSPPARAVAAAVILVALMVVGACASGVSEPDAASTSSTATSPTSPTSVVAPTTSTTVGATTTSTTPTPLVHVFPIDPPAVASYGAGHHDYPATDIFCPAGSRFVAPTGGTVDFVSTVDTWDPAVDEPSSRGGLSVAIVGDDGVRYYGSHLSAVAPGIVAGARVAAGDLLGATGRSGNAAGVDPHLHFGVSRPTTPDDWATRRGQVDTFPLLQAWEQGENVTPTVPAA